MSFKLDKPYNDKQYADFVVKYNHEQGLEIKESDTAVYALAKNEQWNSQTQLPEINPNYDDEQLAKAKLQAKQTSYQALTDIEQFTFYIKDQTKGVLLKNTPTMTIDRAIGELDKVAQQIRGLQAGAFRYYDIQQGQQLPSPELKPYDVNLLYFQMFLAYREADAYYTALEKQYNSATTIDEINQIVASIDYKKTLADKVDTIYTQAKAMLKLGTAYKYIEIGSQADNTLPEGFKTVMVRCQEGADNVTLQLPELVRGGRVYIENLRTTEVTLKPFQGEKINGVTGDLAVDGQTFITLEADAETGTWDTIFQIDLAPQQGGSSLIFVDNKGNEIVPTKVKALPGSIEIVKQDDGSVMFDVPPHIKANANEGIFATLNYNEQINTDFHDQRPYYSDTGISGGEYVYPDVPSKSFVVQETDNKDPNLTDGTPFLLANYVKFQDNPVANMDCYVELKAVDVMTNEVLTDKDGNPLAIRRDFKAGQRIDELLLADLYYAKGAKKVAFEINTDITGDVLILESDSCVCVQSLSKGSDTGLALMAFENHTGYRIHIENRYYGINYQNLAMSLTKDKPEAELYSTVELMGNGLFIDCTTNTKVKIENNKLVLSGNGSLTPIWVVGMLSDTLDSYILKGMQERLTVRATNKDCQLIYGIMKWDGEGNPKFPIIEKFENTNPVFAQGWTLVADSIIAKSDDIDKMSYNNFTIPTTMKQYATVLYPINQTPTSVISIADFEGDITDDKMHHYIKSTFPITEEHLRNTEGVYRGITVLDPSERSLRYTVNQTPTKLPFGIVSGIGTDIVNLNNWYTSSLKLKCEGDGQFKKSGTVTASIEAQVLNETSSLNTVTFWLAKVESDGSLVEVPNSRFSTTVVGSRTTPKLIKTDSFVFKVEPNEQYRIMAESDIADGFYLQTTKPHVPLLRISIDYKAVTEFEQDILDRLTELEKKVKP